MEMQYEPPLPDPNYWKMHFDGSKTRMGLGAGIVLTSPKRDHVVVLPTSTPWRGPHSACLEMWGKADD